VRPAAASLAGRDDRRFDEVDDRLAALKERVAAVEKVIAVAQEVAVIRAGLGLVKWMDARRDDRRRKGIRQGIETARVLARYEPSRWSRERNFLLIVTFKDLYLGTGADFFSYVVQERVTSALGAPASESIIPLEHMYFISVAEFDYLVEALKANSLKLDAILREVSIADQVPETKCLQISQHLLRRWGALPAPSYIDSEFNAMFDRALRTLGVKGVRA
jgi:hypothetical protein